MIVNKLKLISVMQRFGAIPSSWEDFFKELEAPTNSSAKPRFKDYTGVNKRFRKDVNGGE